MKDADADASVEPAASDAATSARAPLTRERVLSAAVRLADEAGIDALSMRRLAGECGVEAMSLYHHVANKDEVLDGMVDLVAAEIELPTSDGDWRAAMRRRACSAHAVLLRHPWASQLFTSRINIGPAMLRYIDATLGCLRAAGFTPEQADHAWNAIDSHVYGFTLQELNFPFEADEYSDAAADYMHLIASGQHPHLNELATEVMQGRYDGLHDFEFGLEFLLDGLERLREG